MRIKTEVIEKYQKNHQLSTSAFCRLCKISKKTCDKIMYGDQRIRLMTCVKIIYGMQLNDFFALVDINSL